MNQKIKISQLPAKGSNLAAQDLIEIAEFTGTGYVSKSITGAEIAAGATAGFVPETRTLTINGVTQDLSANRTFTISTGITIGSTAIASGVVGRVLFEGAGNVVQESANFTFDTVTNLLTTNGSILVGSSLISASPYPLQVVGGAGGSALFSNTTRTQALNINLTTANETRIYTDYFLTGTDQKLILGTFANRANQLVLNTTGNVLIGTTTDAGFRLDVNGTARVQGQLTLNNNVLITSGEKYIFFNTTSTFLAGVENPTVYFGYNFGTRAIHIGSLGSGNILFRSLGNVCLDQATSKLLIGTTTDAGFRLDVNGTARVSSTGNVLTINDSSNSRNFTFNPSYATSTYGGFFNHSTGNITLGASLGTDNGSTIGIFLGGPAGNRNASALLQIDSTSRGFLPPRMTTTQKNAIASPATGLQVYDTTLNQMSYYNGTTWTNI